MRVVIAGRSDDQPPAQLRRLERCHVPPLRTTPPRARDASMSDDELQLEGNSSDSDSDALQLEGNNSDADSEGNLRLEGNQSDAASEELQLEDNVFDNRSDSDSDDTLGWKNMLPSPATSLNNSITCLSLDDVEELTQPPTLPPLPGDEAAPQLGGALPPQRAAGNAGTALMQMVGVVGSHRPAKQPIVDELAREGSTLEEGLHPSKHPHVLDLCHKLMVFHTSRLLADATWCEAYAKAVESLVARARSCGVSTPRVCVLGLGSAVPALAAARAGAEVVWVERVARFVDVMARLAAANGVGASVRVARVTEWSELVEQGQGQGQYRQGQHAEANTLLQPQSFDAVISEEVDDSLLAEGIVDLARLARATLLKPLTTSTPPAVAVPPLISRCTAPAFCPCRATLKCMLLSVRTTQVSGFDLRGFNAFAVSAQGSN